MNVPVEIVVVFLLACLSIQSWMLIEIVKLKTRVSSLVLRLDLHLHPERKAGDTDHIMRPKF